MNGISSVIGGGMIGPAVSPGMPGIGVSTPIFATLPLCIDQAGHRFAIALHHRDCACCERCGLIREASKK